jgi:hypothetical protein
MAPVASALGGWLVDVAGGDFVGGASCGGLIKGDGDFALAEKNRRGGFHSFFGGGRIYDLSQGRGWVEASSLSERS